MSKEGKSLSAKGLNRTLRLVFILFFLLFVGGLPVAAVGVRPLVMELQMLPGDQRQVEINLIPGDEEETVDLTLYEAVQQPSGGLSYQLPANPGFSVTGWVSLDTQVVKVRPGAEAKALATIKVPFTAAGSHTVIVMVEPRLPQVKSGVGFKVRYAVRLSIQVEKSGLRPSAVLSSCEIRADQQGAPEIVAKIKNDSALDYLVSGEAVIRDGARRLVERAVLKTDSGSLPGSNATRLYPGAEVLFLGKLSQPLAPGEYSLQVFFRYGENGQILSNEKFAVKPDQFVYPGQHSESPVLIKPILAEHYLRAGERKTQIFEFQNTAADPTRIEIALGQTAADEEHSLLDWLELRSPAQFVLPTGAKARLAVTIACPRETKDGSYHGQLFFRAYAGAENEVQSEIAVPVNALVGTEFHPEVEIRSIAAQQREEGSYISLDLKNSGNAAVLPRIEALIFTLQGEYVQRATFELPESVSYLLPGESRQAAASIPLLEPGPYKLEFTITLGEKQIFEESRKITVNN